MIDLEEEFQKLMQESINKVKERYDNGELSANESADLILMIHTRMQPAPIHDPGEPEGGWQQSSWCGDTGWDASERCW